MFDIITARDFYAMLVEDFDDFIAEPHSVRRALHCAITAYHMHDWVWADWLKDDDQLRSSLGIGNKKADFAAWLMRGSPWFQMIAAVANGTKHFIARSDFETIRVVPVPGNMPVGPHGKGYLIFDLGEEAQEHRIQPVAHILEAVVRLWRDFLRQHRPAELIPVSRHHVD